MLPFGLFRSRAFTLLNLYTLTLFAGFGGTFFFVALYAQGALGYSALAAGLVVLPTTLSLLLLSRPFAALADRVGSRTLLCAGPLACAAGMVVLTEARAGAYVETLLVGGVILGVGPRPASGS
jgi:Na+/melibiose symporter-like transporter